MWRGSREGIRTSRQRWEGWTELKSGELSRVVPSEEEVVCDGRAMAGGSGERD